MIKKLLFNIFLFYSIAVVANDSIPSNALKTCLFQHSSIDGVNYSSIDISAVITDSNYSTAGEVRYVDYKGTIVGYGSSRSGMAFYKDSESYPLSKSKIIEIGLLIKTIPKEIDYSISEWGYIKLNNKTFICVNVPFSGVGESGKHQDIRNVFVYNTKSNDIYYTVGDVKNKL
ncbi:hypothetical protein [Atlantibacter sp.]|uniref:hypothetical protein n=1 Tax=Atlantibacter sp. TaxID=1903473 RepID=UPI0028B10C81|nr:hypothetical protein [Atlantibacter sp.]